MFWEGQEDSIPFLYYSIVLHRKSENIERISRRISIEDFDWFTSYPWCNSFFGILIRDQSCLSEIIICPSYIGIRTLLKFTPSSHNFVTARMGGSVVEVDRGFVGHILILLSIYKMKRKTEWLSSFLPIIQGYVPLSVLSPKKILRCRRPGLCEENSREFV